MAWTTERAAKAVFPLTKYRGSSYHRIVNQTTPKPQQQRGQQHTQQNPVQRQHGYIFNTDADKARDLMRLATLSASP